MVDHAATDLHATFSDFTTNKALNFRRRASDCMLRVWMELTSILAGQSALRRLGSRDHSIDRSREIAPASEARASQNSQITLAVDSG
jgi:hypothetical protein